MLNEVSEGVKWRTHLQLFWCRTVIDTHNEAIIESAKHIDVKLVLSVCDIAQHYAAFGVHSLTPHIHIQLFILVYKF
jgi:hypothetical protein